MTASESLDWFDGRRVVVTGHTGFKGAWLSLWLQRLGAQVVGYALPPEPRSLFEATGLAAGMTSISGDVRDRESLSTTLKDAEPEIIFHLAAQSIVGRSYDQPVETFETNVMGAVNVLDGARALPGLRAIVMVTSDKCYENPGLGVPFTEEMPMGGHDPYSASKGCTELVTAAFCRSFYVEGPCVVASARAGNVIGGGDWASDRLVPDLVRATETSVPVKIRRPDAVRPWQHVLEPLRGYLMLGARAATEGDRFGGAWNFGPRLDDAIPVRSIVEKVQRLWPVVRAELADVTEGPHEAGALRLDCSKADRLLGWRPVLDIDAALSMAVTWYREALEAPSRAADITQRQIDDYERLAGLDLAGSR